MTDNPVLKNLTLLGQSGVPAQKKLEWFPAPGTEESREDENAAPGRVGLITFIAPEFTSMCPMTKQPDFGTVKIEYIPDDRCLESKSWKLYLQTFRDQGIFYEQLAVQIKHDLWEALEPLWLRVTLTQAPRGGISLEVVSSVDKRRGEVGGRGSDQWGKS